MSGLIKMNYKPNQIHSVDVIDYHKCPICGTEFPEMWVWDKVLEHWFLQIMCNGVEIKECPYCKP